MHSAPTKLENPSEEMNRYCRTVVVNICLLMIPFYVIYDGISTIQTEVLRYRKPVYQESQKRPPIQPSDVIINTYMRAGSSFIGKMLGFRGDAFYVYEPLWMFHRYGYYRGTKEVCWTFSPACRMLAELSLRLFFRKTSDVDAAMTFLRSLYECRFLRYNKYFKENIQQKMSGPSWNIYHRCRKNKQVENMTTCLQNEIPVCRNAKHRVTKVLRMSLDLMEIFLKEKANMKVVHLFRDPRAIINSHFQTTWSPLRRQGREEQFTKAARALCDRMLRDIEMGERLLKTFPTRFKMIQYEDFDDPSSKIDILYKFLGMSHVKETQQYISKPETDVKSGSSAGTKGNHPFKYRTMMKWSTVRLIDKQCSGVYDKLGYTNYSDEQSYRNLSVSGIQTKLPYTM